VARGFESLLFRHNSSENLALQGFWRFYEKFLGAFAGFFYIKKGAFSLLYPHCFYQFPCPYQVDCSLQIIRKETKPQLGCGLFFSLA
jgi:hypothetical protein